MDSYPSTRVLLSALVLYRLGGSNSCAVVLWTLQQWRNDVTNRRARLRHEVGKIIDFQ